MLPGRPDLFTKIQWFLFQTTLLILFVIGLIRLIRSCL
jgi:hypothetical protein